MKGTIYLETSDAYTYVRIDTHRENEYDSLCSVVDVEDVPSHALMNRFVCTLKEGTLANAHEALERYDFCYARNVKTILNEEVMYLDA